MKLVKKTAEYSIYQRNDKRYAVKGANKKWINGDDKVGILIQEKLAKALEPKPAEPEEAAPVEEESTDASTE